MTNKTQYTEGRILARVHIMLENGDPMYLWDKIDADPHGELERGMADALAELGYKHPLEVS